MCVMSDFRNLRVQREKLMRETVFCLYGIEQSWNYDY